MSVLIKIDGVSFDEKYVIGKAVVPEPDVPLVISDYPVTDGLKGLFTLGSDYDSVRNYAPEPHVNTDAPKLDGTYEMADNYITFSGTGNGSRLSTYLRLPLDGGLTFVALFSVTADGSAINRPIISNMSSSSGLSLGNRQVTYKKNAVTQLDYFEENVLSDKFAILAMTADASGYRVVRYSNGGIVEWKTGKESTGIDAWSNNAIQVGGESTTSPYATARISLAAIHTGKLTDDQLRSVCRFVNNYGKQKGLTIE